MSIPRELESTVRAHFRERPAILLTGSRQAGKTWLLRNAFREAEYLNLDLPSLAEEA
jgi:predicted AAA+ superfamily ATPase